MNASSKNLARGDSGKEVRELQLRLAGFRGTSWDGQFGPGTELQVITFQRDYMGMESPDPILCAVTDPDNPQSQVSPAGMEFDPVLDFFERPPVCDANEDGDNDGVVNEIDPAIVDHVEFYLLNYFKPATGKTNRRTNRGPQNNERNRLYRLSCTGL